MADKQPYEFTPVSAEEIKDTVFLGQIKETGGGSVVTATAQDIATQAFTTISESDSASDIVEKIQSGRELKLVEHITGGGDNDFNMYSPVSTSVSTDGNTITSVFSRTEGDSIYTKTMVLNTVTPSLNWTSNVSNSVSVLGTISELPDTATEADLVAGNYLALDGADGTMRLPAELMPSKSNSYSAASLAASSIDGVEIEQRIFKPLNMGKRLGLDGTIVDDPSATTIGVTDFIQCRFGIGEIKFLSNKNTLGVAFYDSAKNFVSGIKATEAGTAMHSGWYYSTDVPDIPSDAFFVVIQGNDLFPQKAEISCGVLTTELNHAVVSSLANQSILKVKGIGETLKPFGIFKSDTAIDNNGEEVAREYCEITDFIDVTNGIETIQYADRADGLWGVAFYDINKEFISGLYASNNGGTAVIGGWYKTTQVPTIPSNAVYIRIKGNSTINAPLSIATKVIKVLDPENKQPRPSSGYEFFAYYVDCGSNDVDDTLKSTSVQGVKNLSVDNGLVMLPSSYNESGKKTPLVIFNHGAGGSVTTETAEGWQSTEAKLMLARGYALLFVNGIPEAFRNTKYCNRAQNGAAAHMGGDIFIRSVRAALDYVVSKYNVSDEVFVIGRSMGGVSALNIANSGNFKVKALALDAPVIDLYKDAYFSGGWSQGTLQAGTFGVIAWMYQFNGCNFSDDTYTINGTTKSMSQLKNSVADCEDLWAMNKHKVVGYNAYKTGDFLIKNLDDSYVDTKDTDNDQDYFGKKLPCPCKIWFGAEDGTNQIAIARRFVTKCANGGSIAIMRTLPTADHCVWGRTTTTGSAAGVDITTTSDGITCCVTDVELCNWLDQWK